MDFFYLGCAVMALAVLGALVSWLVFRIRKKRLYGKLEEEYGKKRC